MPDSDVPNVPLMDKFAPFSISTHAYKTVDDHPILVDIFLPKTLLNDVGSAKSKEKYPVVVRIHGGWLVGGQRNYGPWSPAWLLEFALLHNAIIVAPDYRLLPEANVEEILDDIDDFWAWVGADLPRAVQEAGKGIDIDLERVLVAGESAGGYLAIQLALAHFKPPPSQSGGSSEISSTSAPHICALIAVYPILDMRAPHYTQDYDKVMFDAPQLPMSLVDAHLDALKSAPKRPVISNAFMDGTESRSTLAIALVQRGRFLEVLGEERDTTPGRRRIHPEERVIDGRKLPPTFFIHGTEDSAVPVEGTDKFIDILKTRNAVEGMQEGGAEVACLQYARVPGDHGFDSDLHLVSEEWLKKGCTFVESNWLRG